MTKEYYEMRDGTQLFVGSRLDFKQCQELLLAGGVVSIKYKYAPPISADEGYIARIVEHTLEVLPCLRHKITAYGPVMPLMERCGWLGSIENYCGEGWHACCVHELPPSVPAPESAPGVDYKSISEQLRKDLDCVTSTLMRGIDCCRDANSPVEAADLAVKYLAELTRADQRKPDDFQVMIRELEDMAYTSVVARDVLRQIRSTSDYATYLRIILGLIKLNSNTMNELLNSRMREATSGDLRGRMAKDGSRV